MKISAPRIRDVEGRDLELRYFRDTDGREVDFVVTEERRRYLKSRFPEAEAWQIAGLGQKEYVSPEGIRVGPSVRFLGTLV